MNVHSTVYQKTLSQKIVSGFRRLVYLL